MANAMLSQAPPQPRSLSASDLENAAAAGDVVMREDFANVIDPWPAERVAAIAIGQRQRTLLAGPGADTAVLVQEATAQEPEFATFFPTVLKKLCTHAFVRDPENLQLVHALITTRLQVQRGQLAQKDADQKVASDTLTAMYRRVQAARTQGDVDDT